MLNTSPDRTFDRVYFMDEGRFGLKSTYTRTWSRRGVTPVVPVLQGYRNFYAYACVAPGNGDHFALFLPEVKTEMMDLFLRQFARQHRRRRLLLVLDQAGWHVAQNLRVPPTCNSSISRPTHRSSTRSNDSGAS